MYWGRRPTTALLVKGPVQGLLGRLRRVPLTHLALAVAALAALGLGFAASAGWEPHLGSLSELYLRRSLTVMGGSLLFGAGLLQMSMWRLGDDAARAYLGAALVVLGLLSTLTQSTGHLLHAPGPAASLSPLTLAWAAVAALGLTYVALARPRALAPQVVRPSVVAAALVAGTLVVLVALSEVERHVDLRLTMSPAVQVRLELVVAAAWAVGGYAAHRRTRPGTGLPAITGPVLWTLALLWVLRAAAVTDLTVWGTAAAALLTMVATVVLVAVTTDFVEAAETEHIRAEEAERAVVSAALELQQHDDETRTLNHDARNMLLALRTATQTLADHSERLGEDVRHELERAIAAEAARLDALIADHVRAARERHRRPAPAPARGHVPAQRESVGLGAAR